MGEPPGVPYGASRALPSPVGLAVADAGDAFRRLAGCDDVYFRT
jgi:hypothetical protein